MSRVRQRFRFRLYLDLLEENWLETILSLERSFYNPTKYTNLPLLTKHVDYQLIALLLVQWTQPGGKTLFWHFKIT
jgi:hypothetical protein